MTVKLAELFEAEVQELIPSLWRIFLARRWLCHCAVNRDVSGFTIETVVSKIPMLTLGELAVAIENMPDRTDPMHTDEVHLWLCSLAIEAEKQMVYRYGGPRH